MQDGEIRIGGWWVRPSLSRMERAGQAVHLRPKSMEVLLFLARRAGQVVARAELLDAMWPGVSVAEEGLTRCIADVRAGVRRLARPAGVRGDRGQARLPADRTRRADGRRRDRRRSARARRAAVPRPQPRRRPGVLRRRADRADDRRPLADPRPARHLPHVGDAVQAGFGERRCDRTRAAGPLRPRGQPPPFGRGRAHHGPAHRRRRRRSSLGRDLLGHGGRRARHPGEGLAGDRGSPPPPVDGAGARTPRPPAGAGLRDAGLLSAREGGDQRVHPGRRRARDRASRKWPRRRRLETAPTRGTRFRALPARQRHTTRRRGPRRGPLSGRSRAPARSGLAAGPPRPRARPDEIRGPTAGVRPVLEARTRARTRRSGRSVLARHGLRQLRGAGRGRTAAGRAPGRHRPAQPAGRGRHRGRALLRGAVRPGRGGVPPSVPGAPPDHRARVARRGPRLRGPGGRGAGGPRADRALTRLRRLDLLERALPLHAARGARRPSRGAHPRVHGAGPLGPALLVAGRLAPRAPRRARVRRSTGWRTR